MTRYAGRLYGALLMLFAASGQGKAAETSIQSPATLSATAPLIDGEIEPQWHQGSLFDGFVQLEPDVSRNVEARTEVYFMYDAKHVYLAARAYQTDNSIRAVQGRRDAQTVQQGDYMAFAIDPSGGGDSAYYIAVNPYGAVLDGMMNSAGTVDTRWDGVFTAVTRIFPEYWTVELRIPLTTIGFQGKSEQDWGILCERYYAGTRQKLLSQLVDENRPYHIGNFHRVTGIRDLRPSREGTLTPYVFAAKQQSADGEGSSSQKTGLELRLHPRPSITTLVTVNPDYAQLESDQEIINVSDVPVSYPEKRPFFTASSDMYPGAAVNTRNIGDIKLGLKMRQALPGLKYDVTAVLDGDDNRWLLGDVRVTDDERFLVEVIGGLKDQATREDYNVTTNIRGWWLEKRLTAYTWLGTINSRDGDGNEWENVNSIRWVTRHLNTGLWSHVRSTLYNPNVVGYEMLSNTVEARAWVERSRFSETSLLRLVSPRLEAGYRDVYSEIGNSYWIVDASLKSIWNLGATLGNLETRFVLRPPLEQWFRYREVEGYDASEIFEDAYGPFVHVRQRRTELEASITSDPSRPVGLSATYVNGPVRASDAQRLALGFYLRLEPKATISYSLEGVDVAGSPYQEPLTELVNRLKAEYNVTRRLNVRGIVDFNVSKRSENTPEIDRKVIGNLTLAWELRPGSFINFVYNDEFRLDPEGEGTDSGSGHVRSAALKVNWVFPL